jgi:hypothetical protein
MLGLRAQQRPPNSVMNDNSVAHDNGVAHVNSVVHVSGIVHDSSTNLAVQYVTLRYMLHSARSGNPIRSQQYSVVVVGTVAATVLKPTCINASPACVAGWQPRAPGLADHFSGRQSLSTTAAGGAAAAV